MDDALPEELGEVRADRRAWPLLAGWRRDPAALRLLLLVATHTGVPVEKILAESRCRVGVAGARQLAMYLTNVLLGRSLTDVGRLYGRDRTTVAYACHLMEDRRDDPAFEAEVEAIERRLAADAVPECRHAAA